MCVELYDHTMKVGWLSMCAELYDHIMKVSWLSISLCV